METFLIIALVALVLAVCDRTNTPQIDAEKLLNLPPQALTNQGLAGRWKGKIFSDWRGSFPTYFNGLRQC